MAAVKHQAECPFKSNLWLIKLDSIIGFVLACVYHLCSRVSFCAVDTLGFKMLTLIVIDKKVLVGFIG